ncbi:sugar kinase [Arthrobacter sp. H41]|uniref:sugar kinase n=1 Tax=Arthrobacter sp. H41 TaxID=1312978 RepID=UPI0004B67C01|nr:sugar kinase [Arthrobacter sp. H41]
MSAALSQLMPVDVLTFGETMGSIRSAGLVRLGGSMSMSLGGAETNVAIGLARLGHSVRWTGRLGDDEVGAFALRSLRAENVATDAVVIDAERTTGLMLLEARFAGVSRALYYRSSSAGSALTSRDLEASLDAAPRILHLSGITPALSPAAAEATLWAASEARKRGILVSFDVNYRAKLWDAAAASTVLTRLAGYADIVIASDDELSLVSAGIDEEYAVNALHGRGVRDVIIKRGAEGATGWSEGAVVHQDALPVAAVDTVGAGDAFTAGYLSALLDGEAMVARLRRGAVLGAFAVAASGDWENLPTRSELALADRTAGSTIR